MTPPPGLEDPDYAAFAWRRFRRVMAWMALAAVIVTGGAIAMMEHWFGPLGWVAILAAIGGFGGSMLLAAMLMGLMFLSSGSGHDEVVDAQEELAAWRRASEKSAGPG